MADASETPTPETPATPTPTSTAPVVLGPADALWQAVKDAATTKGIAVRDLVIAELTNTEIIKRKDAVLVVLTKHEEKAKELKKQEKALVKVEYNADNTEARRYYDAEGNKALKALRDEIAALSTALSNFFDKNDTNKLFELSGANKK